MTEKYITLSVVIIVIVLVFVSNRAIIWTMMLLAFALLALGLLSGYGYLPEWQG